MEVERTRDVTVSKTYYVVVCDRCGRDIAECKVAELDELIDRSYSLTASSFSRIGSRPRIFYLCERCTLDVEEFIGCG